MGSLDPVIAEDLLVDVRGHGVIRGGRRVGRRAVLEVGDDQAEAPVAVDLRVESLAPLRARRPADEPPLPLVLGPVPAVFGEAVEERVDVEPVDLRLAGRLRGPGLRLTILRLGGRGGFVSFAMIHRDTGLRQGRRRSGGAPMPWATVPRSNCAAGVDGDDGGVA